MARAIIFDFDGLILDTETAVYESWRLTFLELGAEPIDRERWTATIGLADDESIDPLAELRRQLGRVDDRQIQIRRRAHRDRLLARQPIRPGIAAWLAAAAIAERPTAVASSSPVGWVDGHLRDRRLLHHFPVRSCAGDGVPGKPAPDVYHRACVAVGVDPADALAIEDSPNGVRAAKAAGLTCVAVPGPMTESLDFAHADLVVSSLADLDPTSYL